jgi:subtilisin family serine protease
MRTSADVSALGSNVPMYNKDVGGWITAEGTSAAAPLIAGVYALAGTRPRPRLATRTPRGSRAVPAGATPEPLGGPGVRLAIARTPVRAARGSR